MIESCEAVRPFKRLTVENHYNVVTKQRVLVAWALNPAFTEPGPYVYTLQRGRAADDDKWTDISTTVDQPWLYDNYPVFGVQDRATFYRVILVDGRGTRYVSQPVETDMSWNHHDWRRMKEIIRKELLIQQLAGTDGYLLKRRLFGDPCPCNDPNTNEPSDSGCPDCYGTSILGGYYPAQEFKVVMNPTQRLRRLTGDEGLVTTVIETFRSLAWPAPAENDIWVMKATNRRYRIQPDIAEIARWRGVDVALDLRVLELPLTDPVYDFPTPGFA